MNDRDLRLSDCRIEGLPESSNPSILQSFNFSIVQFLVIAAVVILAVAPASAQVRSVESFVASKDNWEQLVGVSLTIEGRVSSLSGRLLRFQNCALSFRSLKDLPRLSGRSQNIEVTGKLRKDEGKLHFEVDQLRERPGDADSVRRRQQLIPREKPDEWYELARWTAGRARFYDDDDLQKQADELYARAVQEERAALDQNDFAGLLALAARTKELPVDAALHDELVHQAYRTRWDSTLREGNDVPALRQFMSQLDRDLPGCRTPLDSADGDLTNRYLKNPLKVYSAAGKETRRKLNRGLYGEAALKQILMEADEEGRNGLAIADAIDRELPEQKQLAESYRVKALDYQLAHVGSVTRPEMLALADSFRKRDDADRSRQTVVNWLKSREKQLRNDGPTGLVKLAEEHLELLGDEQQAALLLIEADKLSPGSEEIGSRLRRLGYRLKKGDWFTEKQFQSLPDAAILQAMREGRVAVGMTYEQVQKTLGAPGSFSKIATAGQVTEVWVYGQRGTSRLAIHLVRASNREPQSATVVRVLQLPQ